MIDMLWHSCQKIFPIKPRHFPFHAKKKKENFIEEALKLHRNQFCYDWWLFNEESLTQKAYFPYDSTRQIREEGSFSYEKSNYINANIIVMAICLQIQDWFSTKTKKFRMLEAKVEKNCLGWRTLHQTKTMLLVVKSLFWNLFESLLLMGNHILSETSIFNKIHVKISILWDPQLTMLSNWHHLNCGLSHQVTDFFIKKFQMAELSFSTSFGRNVVFSEKDILLKLRSWKLKLFSMEKFIGGSESIYLSSSRAKKKKKFKCWIFKFS